MSPRNLLFLVVLSLAGCAQLKAATPGLEKEAATLAANALACVTAKALAGETSLAALVTSCAVPAGLDAAAYLATLAGQLEAAAPLADPQAAADRKTAAARLRAVR